MRTTAGNMTGPKELIDQFPAWQASLSDCDTLYRIDKHQAEALRESVATQMAKTIGEETASFLLLQHLFKDNRPESVRDMWRSETIIGIAEVERVLDKEK
jgi:protein involved in temperature-dependent protein secretion